MSVESCLHFIDGKFVPSITGQTFPSVNPATEDVIAQVARGQGADVELAVKAAQRAYKSWSKVTAYERSKLMHRIADLLESERPEIAKLETRDNGKPISETLDGDIPRAVRNFRFFGDLILKDQPFHHDGADGSHFYVRREPLGVVGLITPWNLPLYLATWKVAPALATGNTIVLKPAELTPLSANALARVMQKAGVPDGVFNIVHGFGAGEAGEALVAHPDVRAISFTGETHTGAAIMKTAAPHLKKLSFELGGKGASVITEDADLAAAIPACVRAAFRNQGQICLAGSRLLVHESVYAEVAERLQQETAKIRVGDPLDGQTSMGAVISLEHRERVESFIAYGKQHHKLLIGGSRPRHLSKGAFLEPTIFVDVPQGSRLVQEEIFGPVLTVQKFSNDDSAIDMVNDTRYGLSASVWTTSDARAKKYAESVRTGLFWINAWFIRDLSVPFGGMKHSGIGREGGRWSLDFYSEYKCISAPASQNLETIWT
jgi:aminomuconate-semialdehyde/2-hydroxymuconate-6-semialdehyde dehydrogenase